jgi:hypothetical protein
MTDVWTVGY